MGIKLIFKCTECSWEKELRDGPGVMECARLKSDIASGKIIPFTEDVKKGTYGEPLKNFFEACSPEETDCSDPYSNTLFYCRSCLRYDVAQTKTIEYSYGKNIIRAEISPLCPECGEAMTDARYCNILECPECGGEVVMGDMILFD